MNMQMFLEKIISLYVKQIFETYPTLNVLHYLPQRDQKRLVKYRFMSFIFDINKGDQLFCSRRCLFFNSNGISTRTSHCFIFLNNKSTSFFFLIDWYPRGIHVVSMW